MTSFTTSILIIIAVLSFLPIFWAVGYELASASRKRSPDSLRFRDRLAEGIANAKLAVCQKVAAGCRLVKLLGALVYLTPRFAVGLTGVAIGYAAGWAFGLLSVAVVGGWEKAEGHWKTIDRKAMRVVP